VKAAAAASPAGRPDPAGRALADAIRQGRRWYWQRLSAMVLAICVLVHIATIVYAVHAGLTAEAVLARTRGNVAFAAFYVIFVVACAVHVPIGLARIAEEWLGLAPRVADAAANALAWLLAALGLVAVYGMVAG
jgi:fumarate reductase subunit C